MKKVKTNKNSYKTKIIVKNESENMLIEWSSSQGSTKKEL